MADPDLIERLARESSLAALADPANVMYCNGRLLRRFAALLAEECAKECEKALREYCTKAGLSYEYMEHHSVYRSAAVIRAMFHEPT